MKTKSKVLILFALMIGLNPILKAQTIECFVLTPPSKFFPEVKNIAFLDFENFNQDAYYKTYGGNAFVNYLSAAFLDNSRGMYPLSFGLFSGQTFSGSLIKCNGINKLKIVEREQLYKVLNEKNLSSNGTISNNQATEIGKIMGIDALITGTIKYDYKTARTQYTTTSGQLVYNTENICSAEITVKVISVATGQIMATQSFTSGYKDNKSGTYEGSVMKFEQLAPLNLKDIANQVACYLAPSYLHYRAEFGKIKNNEFKDKVKNIRTYLEKIDLKNAYAVYKSIYDADNYNSIAAANIGELYFITGDYEEAAKWYEIASQIDSKVYGKKYEQMKISAESISKFKQLGIEIEKYDFTISADALADKTHTKGSKSDRYEVYEKADNSSSVQAKVPGDTEFIVIEKSGSFVKIKLLGGKEGYISNDNVKK
jgi:Curli production assembly/transport component CsgG/Bacterial SH3 domain